MNTVALKALSIDERLALIGQLWDSVDEADLPVSAAQREELDRRLADLDTDIAAGRDWTSLRADLQR